MEKIRRKNFLVLMIYFCAGISALIFVIGLVNDSTQRVFTGILVAASLIVSVCFSRLEQMRNGSQVDNQDEK